MHACAVSFIIFLMVYDRHRWRRFCFESRIILHFLSRIRYFRTSIYIAHLSIYYGILTLFSVFLWSKISRFFIRQFRSFSRSDSIRVLFRRLFSIISYFAVFFPALCLKLRAHADILKLFGTLILHVFHVLTVPGLTTANFALIGQLISGN